jgi:hypothetical protein
MNVESEIIWKEAVLTYSKYYHDIYLYGLSKITKNSVRIARVTTEIRSQHLSDVIYLWLYNPFVGTWPFFQFINVVYTRYNSFDDE